jgi:hypothetical protein
MNWYKETCGQKTQNQRKDDQNVNSEAAREEGSKNITYNAVKQVAGIRPEHR